MIAYFKEIFSGLWSLLVGLKLTAGYAMQPTITVHYPFETIELTPNFRGHTDLVIDPATAESKCICCMMCERVCPSQCITVHGEKPEGAKKKVLVRYDLDFTKCSVCGNCVEVCPVDALEFSNDYRLAGFSRHDFHYELVRRLRERVARLGLQPKPPEVPTEATPPGPSPKSAEPTSHPGGA
jgi:NADH-quinone oxidoreductase chain I